MTKSLECSKIAVEHAIMNYSAMLEQKWDKSILNALKDACILLGKILKEAELNPEAL